MTIDMLDTRNTTFNSMRKSLSPKECHKSVIQPFVYYIGVVVSTLCHNLPHSCVIDKGVSPHGPLMHFTNHNSSCDELCYKVVPNYMVLA